MSKPKRDVKGRYLKMKENWWIISCRFDLEDKARIEAFAKKHEMSRTEAIRTLVSWAFDEQWNFR